MGTSVGCGRAALSLAPAVFVVLVGCCGRRHCPRPRNVANDGAETVALVRGSDLLTITHLSNALSAAGIPHRGGGSVSYSLDVDLRHADHARRVLARDGADHGYETWGDGGSASLRERDGLPWEAVPLGRAPIELRRARETDNPVVSAALSSEALIERTAGWEDVDVLRLDKAVRDYVLADGTWTTAYEVRVHLRVDGGTAEWMYLQLIPRPPEGGYLVFLLFSE